MKKRIFAITALALVCFLLLACGDGYTGDETERPVPTADSALATQSTVVELTTAPFATDGAGTSETAASYGLSITKGVNDYALFTYDAALINEMLYYYSGIVPEQTAAELDLTEALFVYVNGYSFAIDPDGVIWLDDQTVNCVDKGTSGLNYTRVNAVYCFSDCQYANRFETPPFTMSYSTDGMTAYSGVTEEARAEFIESLMTNYGLGRVNYKGYATMLFKSDIVIVLSELVGDVMYYREWNGLGYVVSGTLSPSAALEIMGEDFLTAIEMNVPSIPVDGDASTPVTGLQLFMALPAAAGSYKIPCFVIVSQNGFVATEMTYGDRAAAMDVDGDGEYELILTSGGISENENSFRVSVYGLSDGAPTLEYSGVFAAETELNLDVVRSNGLVKIYGTSKNIPPATYLWTVSVQNGALYLINSSGEYLQKLS